MSKDYYLRPEYMWEEILYGSKSHKFFELFDSVTSRYGSAAPPTASLCAGVWRLQGVEDSLGQEGWGAESGFLLC